MWTPEPITAEQVAFGAAHAAFGHRLITNVHRGLIVEAIVRQALPPSWTWCSHDYAPWDFEHECGLRLEVRQSAARQSWHQDAPQRSRPSFDIGKRDGRHGSDGRVLERRRWADVYVLAYHPVSSAEADHRLAEQWEFHVIATADLPDHHSIGLAHVKRLTSHCGYSELGGRRRCASLLPKIAVLFQPLLFGQLSTSKQVCAGHWICVFGFADPE